MLAVLFLHRMSTKRRLALSKRASSAKKTQLDPDSKFCRTCLATECLTPIFLKIETNEKRSHDLKLVTGLEIKMNDGLSQKMCAQCSDAVRACLQFRRASRKAERALRSMAFAAPPPRLNNKYRVRKESKSRIKSELEVEVPEEVDFGCDIYEEGEDCSGGDDYQHLDCSEEATTVIRKKEPAARRAGRAGRVGRAGLAGRAGLFSCGTCHKEFRMKATYKAHMRFHTNFCVCEACGKRCRNNNQLQEHKRARHGLGRIHKCAYCDYSSATKEALTIHERRHTGERPYVCDHCGAAFHRRSNLVQHIAIHLPDKNWQCDMCPKRLKSKKFLQIHKHNAHTGKRYGYLCAVCAHRFEKPNKVRAHTRRVHGLPDDQQAPITRIQL